MSTVEPMTVAALSTLATRLANAPDLRAAMEHLAVTAVAVIDPGEHAEAWLPSHAGRVGPRHCTTAAAEACHRKAHELGAWPGGHTDGPGVITVDDLRTERRWPRFAEGAAALGLVSMLSAPLVDPADPSTTPPGFLRVYAERPDAFDARWAGLAGVLAERASAVLFGRRRLARR